MRQETGDFLVGGPKTEKTWDFLLGHEIFSWDKRQEIFSLRGGQNWKDMRFSLETWDYLIRQETVDFLIGVGPKTEKTWDFLLRQEIFSWDKRKEIFSLGGQTDKIWAFLLRQEIFSWDRRQEIFSLEGPKTDKTWDFLLRHEIFSWDKRQEILCWRGQNL